MISIFPVFGRVLTILHGRPSFLAGLHVQYLGRSLPFCGLERSPQPDYRLPVSSQGEQFFQCILCPESTNFPTGVLLDNFHEYAKHMYLRIENSTAVDLSVQYTGVCLGVM